MADVLEPRVRKWTREEYYKMGELGLFEGQRVELIDGEIIEMSPMGNPHVIAASLAHDALQRAFGVGFWVRHGAPISVSSISEPEPDIAVVKGTPREFKDHPSTALLAVEVSETTLAMDRKRKASLYASAGILDYWIVNLSPSIETLDNIHISLPFFFICGFYLSCKNEIIFMVTLYFDRIYLRL